jgi:hypothetical protein
MHDPMFLVLDVPLVKLDVWHDEPGGADAFTVCGHPPNNGDSPSFGRLLWAWRHRDHLHYRFWPYLRIKYWLTLRCDHCGHRFRWKGDARFSTWGGDKVWHETCQGYQHWRRQCEEAWDYIEAPGLMDDTARWRVEYVLRNRREKALGQERS